MSNSFADRYRAAMREPGLLPDRGRSARTLGRPRMRARPPTRRPHRKVRLLAAGERTHHRHHRAAATTAESQHGRPPDRR